MLLVYGPRSASYDFGPAHPLTPRRFGPGIDLLRAVGAEPRLAPEPALDDELLWCHAPGYLDVVKRFSRQPYGPAEAGIGEGGDDPAFAGMHEAGAMVAGGSIRAMEAILRGDVEHAFHPGGGLHHAMPDHASGFCIYDDPALAIARARRDGLRVLYVDLDVHHGDGVQAIHWPDPGVLTVSFHETGRTLFPGTGGVGELGDGVATGTSVNVPLEPGTGEGAWLAAVEALLPEVAAAFGPDLIVSQHGADSHAWDPLAHLRVTTTAMDAAARLVDRLAHGYAGGRWLATGGGGYDAYRVVPRTWSLVWLAGAHREVPEATPSAWRERWSDEAARYGHAPLPKTFDDEPNAGIEMHAMQIAAERRSLEVAAVVRRLVVPRLLQVARDLGWWDPLAAGESGPANGLRAALGANGDRSAIVEIDDAAAWDRLILAPRVVAPADPVSGHGLVRAAILAGATVSVAIDGDSVVGLAVIAPALAGVVSDAPGPDSPIRELLALGVAPAFRRHGLAGDLLGACLTSAGSEATITCEVSAAERDPVEPLDRGIRAGVARRLLERAGFKLGAMDQAVQAADSAAFRATRFGA